MMPPICAICEKDALEGGDLVDFLKTESCLKWDQKAQNGDWIGHPPYADWFCAAHIQEARSLVHLTLPEALRRMRGN